ncbi:hypothetical protein [Methylobacterium sp.]|uniref:hypothetical protein n=1 Tax=Methylobacterium sp. TaxID=409 RepID=UPI0025D801B7|nr:hypothetical protein [Methylobacterium sp.]MBY0256351.1 hypothetical protein [Methylobacterium sp.]
MAGESILFSRRTSLRLLGGVLMSKVDIYLTAKQVRERYGNCSDMCIWRWLNDDAMRFPKPLVINGRRLWKIADLEAFEIQQATKTEAA